MRCENEFKENDFTSLIAEHLDFYNNRVKRKFGFKNNCSRTFYLFFLECTRIVSSIDIVALLDKILSSYRNVVKSPVNYQLT